MRREFLGCGSARLQNCNNRCRVAESYYVTPNFRLTIPRLTIPHYLYLFAVGENFELSHGSLLLRTEAFSQTTRTSALQRRGYLSRNAVLCSQRSISR